MSARILVAYSSPKGSTAGIAEAIGKSLQSAGYDVDILAMKSVSSLDGYGAVVVGGPLYMGKVVGEVVKFVRKYGDALATVPVAAFCAGVWPRSERIPQTKTMR